MSERPARGAEVRPRGLDQPPPFWGDWRRIYWFVAALLGVELVLFTLLTRWAS
jgi:hypothetical protein